MRDVCSVKQARESASDFVSVLCERVRQLVTCSDLFSTCFGSFQACQTSCPLSAARFHCVSDREPAPLLRRANVLVSKYFVIVLNFHET